MQVNSLIKKKKTGLFQGEMPNILVSGGSFPPTEKDRW